MDVAIQVKMELFKKYAIVEQIFELVSQIGHIKPN